MTKKKIKAAIIFILIVLLIIILSVCLSNYNKKKNALKVNPETLVGNTGGNIYNGGTFIETGDYIYFANILDNNRLYKMDKSLTHFTKLSNNSVSSLNTDGENIYFSKTNYENGNIQGTAFDLSSTGIYRYSLKTNKESRLYNGVSLNIVLAGNTLYYQEYISRTLAMTFNSITTDGSEQVFFEENNFIPASIYNRVLYYSGNSADHKLYSYNLDTKATTLLYKGNTLCPFATDAGIYFIDIGNGYKLSLLKYNSATPAVICDTRVVAYNITDNGRYIFYQSEKSKDRVNGLYKYDLVLGTDTLILAGDYSNINITSDYVFYTTYNKSQSYCYHLSTSKNQNFIPSVMK